VNPRGAAARASAADSAARILGLVEVDAGGAGGAKPGGQRQVVEEAVGDEGDVGAVECGGEPAGDAGQPGDDQLHAWWRRRDEGLDLLV